MVSVTQSFKIVMAGRLFSFSKYSPTDDVEYTAVVDDHSDDDDDNDKVAATLVGGIVGGKLSDEDETTVTGGL